MLLWISKYKSIFVHLKKLMVLKGCKYIDISPIFKKNPANSSNGILNAGIKKIPIWKRKIMLIATYVIFILINSTYIIRMIRTDWWILINVFIVIVNESSVNFYKDTEEIAVVLLHLSVESRTRQNSHCLSKNRCQYANTPRLQNPVRLHRLSSHIIWYKHEGRGTKYLKIKANLF